MPRQIFSTSSSLNTPIGNTSSSLGIGRSFTGETTTLNSTIVNGTTVNRSLTGETTTTNSSIINGTTVNRSFANGTTTTSSTIVNGTTLNRSFANGTTTTSSTIVNGTTLNRSFTNETTGNSSVDQTPWEITATSQMTNTTTVTIKKVLPSLQELLLADPNRTREVCFLLLICCFHNLLQAIKQEQNETASGFRSFDGDEFEMYANDSMTIMKDDMAQSVSGACVY
jgi:hypothetical protein